MSNISSDSKQIICLESKCLHTKRKNYLSQNELSKFSSAIKTFCLQQLYKAALSSLVEAQQPGALNAVRLQLGNKEKQVNIKIPIMFIIGDNQGGDTICGRKCHYGKTAKRISRTCNAGPEQLSNPRVGSCSRIIMREIMTLVNDNKEEELNNLYQVPHWVAWFDLDYGGNPEGIFTAACPPEALHALENGIYFHVLKELFAGILKPTASALIDAVANSWNQYPSQHYLRSFPIDGYPRLLYTSGISKMTDLKADDKVGIIFCIVIAGIQEEGRRIILTKTSVDANMYRNIIYVFELMLCYHAWLKRKKFWECNDKDTMYNAQMAVEKLLQEIIKLIPRSTGNNWEISKIHEQLHVVENIHLLVHMRMYIQVHKSTIILRIQRSLVNKYKEERQCLIGS